MHPRDNDLVLGTHSRGLWILDSLAVIQELTPAVLSCRAHLFSIRPAEMIRYPQPKAHAGDLIFRGDNPPAGAIIDYVLGADIGKAALSVHDRAGNPVQTLEPTTSRGVNRVVWNLRHAPLPPPASGGGDDDEERRGGPVPGPFVVPGEYVVRLAAGGQVVEQRVLVSDDPRIEVAQTERERWSADQIEVGGLYRDATALVEFAGSILLSATCR